MTAFIGTATPFQLAELQRHKARLARIRSAAVARRPVPAPTPIKPKPAPEPLPFPFPYMPDVEINSGRVSVDLIKAIICRDYGLSRGELIANRRNANVVLPRQIAMYLAKELTPMSLPHIGRRFGNRDHTTVLHSVRKIARMVATDIEFAGRIDALRRELGVENA